MTFYTELNWQKIDKKMNTQKYTASSLYWTAAVDQFSGFVISEQLYGEIQHYHPSAHPVN